MKKQSSWRTPITATEAKAAGYVPLTYAYTEHESPLAARVAIDLRKAKTKYAFVIGLTKKTLKPGIEIWRISRKVKITISETVQQQATPAPMRSQTNPKAKYRYLITRNRRQRQK